MPTKVYYLDVARTDAITASWGLFFRDFKLEYQGQPLTEADATRKLKQGREYPLPDGRVLLVRLQEKFGAQGLDMQLNGEPVAGTVNDPQAQVNMAFGILLFIAGFTTLMALLAMFGNVELLARMGLGWGAIAEGGVYVGLAWLGKYRLSAVAFYVALALLVLDGVMLLGAGAATGGFVVRVLFGIAVYRGATGAKQLRANRTADAPSPLLT